MKNLYKFFSISIIFIIFFSNSSKSQNIWFNEIHYSDIGTDTNEFIEVILQDPGNFALSSFSIVLYNGNNGAEYDTKTLDLFTPGVSFEGYRVYYYMYPTNGIQNGAPDGMALTYNDVVVPGQFLSYEGVFTATDGPANGLTSVDIGVEEGGEDDGMSLQLAGQGSEYLNFTWQPPAGETHGELNNGQDLLPLGINIPNELEFVVYPNPNHGQFNLVNPWNEAAELTVSSLIGQKISQYKVLPGENKLSADLEKGIYFLVLFDKENKFRNMKTIIVN